MHRARSRFDDFEDEFDAPDGDVGGRGEGGEKLKRLALDLVGRWYWIAAGLILGVLASAYFLSKAPKIYASTATLLLKTQTASVMANDQVEDINPASIEAMNTTIERIARFDLLERVASRQDVRALPGLVPPATDWRPEWLRRWRDGDAAAATNAETPAEPPPPAALAGRIKGWLRLSIRPKTRLLDITVVHQVPEVAEALANAIAREYLAEIQSDASEGRSTTIDLLRAESEDAREQLQNANAALSIYARALEAVKALDAQEVEVARLDQRYLPAHPKMIGATAELERLEREFINEFDITRNSPSDKKYWEGVGSELPSRTREPDEFLRSARQLLLARIGVLNSEIESQTQVFNSMLTRIEESSVNQESNETSAEVSSLARSPGWPSGPVAKNIYTMGVGGGLAGGLLVAFIFVRLDNKYHTVAQLEDDCRKTVLAAVSEINPSHLAQAEKRHYRKHPDQSPEAYLDWDPHLVFRPGTANTSYAEMYRILRASISLLGDETQRKITLFTSALPGEGKTATSANFALAAAGQQRRTLLIDLDLRKPSLHKVFGLPKERDEGGITESLAGLVPIEQTVVPVDAEPNLHLILAGKRAPNPGELLDTGRLKSILNWAVENYDVVVLDTAPLLAVPDTRIIAPQADNLCLVVRGQYVPKGAVRRTLEVLDEDGTHLCGVVFNGFKETRRLIGQNYSYGHYRTSRYGRPYQYGYGRYGAYGAYGSDQEDEDDKQRKKSERRRNKRRRKAKV